MNPKTKLLLGILVIGIILISGLWIWESQTGREEISEEEAIRIASQTEEVREFLKLYPDAKVRAIFNAPLAIGAQFEWTVSYIPSEKEENLNALVTYLNVRLDNFGNIKYINPGSEIIKDEERCNHDYQCYGINYPNKVDCVNFIYAWRIQKDLDTPALFHCSESAICHSDVPCKCINNKCVFKETESQVTITTDKTEYEQGETVKITVKNNLDNSIWYLNGHSGCSDKNKSYTIYRLVNGTWKNVSPPVKCIQIIGAGLPIYKELTPSASTEFIWDQKIWSAVNGTIQAPDGEYRISVKYKESREAEELKEVYPNEFMIKEKEEVTITTDKTEYERGETVKITIRNDLDEKIILTVGCSGFFFKIQKFSENEWKRLTTSCGVCERELSDVIDLHTSKVYDWNQQTFTDIGDCNSLEQVSPGRYRVMIQYMVGEKFGGEVYSNEFTIKEKEECSIKTPKTMELKTLYNFSVIDSDYVEVHLPKKLCILSYPYGTDGYYIVQFKGPIYEEYTDQVRSLGGVIYSYIPKYAFIVKMNESVKERVQNLEVVRWVGLHQPAYKLRPYLLSEIGNLTLDIGIFDGENTTDVINKIEALEGVVIVASGNQIRVLINASRIPNIANIIGVEWIEKYVMPRLT